MKRCWLLPMLMLTAALAAACSTTPVPGVCCLGSEDCGRLGLSEDRPCPQGQACVDFHCAVPTCSIQGCAAEAPVCDVTVDVCTGCSDSADCSRFGDTGICNPQTGSCVECLAAADCTAAAEPVCADGACRACRLDPECPSGACGEDGACVAEANIVYLSPTGVDLGTCARSSPCKGISFAATRTSASRNHIVMAQGTYHYGYAQQDVTTGTAVASNVFIHGRGALLSALLDGQFLTIGIRATIRDLEISGGEVALSLFGTEPILVERVKIRGPRPSGINVSTQVTMRDVDIRGVTTGIRIHDRLTIERGVIHDVATAIVSGDPNAVVDLTNLLVFGTSDIAIDLAMSAGGTIRSTTIADSGMDMSNGPRAVKCPIYAGALTIRSSIIWAPGVTPRVPINDTCTLVSTIAGPTAVPGATNVDPLFVNAAQRDYHLSPNSPARDVADSGPSTDFEGDPRPRGARFDIGADEAP